MANINYTEKLVRYVARKKEGLLVTFDRANGYRVLRSGTFDLVASFGSDVTKDQFEDIVARIDAA